MKPAGDMSEKSEGEEQTEASESKDVPEQAPQEEEEEKEKEKEEEEEEEEKEQQANEPELENKYTFFVGPGNNSELVRQTFERRPWWELGKEDDPELNLKWLQVTN